MIRYQLALILSLAMLPLGVSAQERRSDDHRGTLVAAVEPVCDLRSVTKMHTELVVAQDSANAIAEHQHPGSWQRVHGRRERR
jgi:hypothetical protein